MDIFLVVGMVAMAVIFRYAISDLFTDFGSYFQIESVIMVIGGVIAATIMMSSGREFLKILKVSFIIFFKKKLPSPEETVKELIGLSGMYHRMGRMSLQGKGHDFGDGYLGRGVQMIVDRVEPEFIRTVMENDIFETKKRHNNMINVYKTGSAFSPMFGLIGTVTGIIQVLKNLDDPSKIGPAMSLALLTTLYGVLLSTLFFLPLANKLKKRSDEEMLIKDIILEGVILVANGEIPLKVEKYLQAYLANSTREKSKG